MAARRISMRRGPGLISTLARSVAIAGTATARDGVAGQEPWSSDEVSALHGQMDELQALEVAAATAPRAEEAARAVLDRQISQLARLRRNGVLSDSAFTEAMARLLGL
jgi:hypothetical protein